MLEVGGHQPPRGGRLVTCDHVSDGVVLLEVPLQQVGVALVGDEGEVAWNAAMEVGESQYELTVVGSLHDDRVEPLVGLLAHPDASGSWVPLYFAFQQRGLYKMQTATEVPAYRK